jgi:hypothetical protein
VALDRMLTIDEASSLLGIKPADLRREIKADMWRVWTTTDEPDKPKLIRLRDVKVFLAGGRRKP